MKKKAFTLAELLISLCIIGVLVAILTPQLANVKPNKDRLLVMKYYNTIMDKVGDLLTNRGIYFDGSDNNGCRGLECTSAPSLPDYANCVGDTKFACLLASELDINDNSNANPFTLAPGVTCQVNYDNANAHAEITLNFDGGGCNYSDFSNNSCSKINQYQFSIDRFGRLVQADTDRMVLAFLQNPTQVQSFNEDMETATNIDYSNFQGASSSGRTRGSSSFFGRGSSSGIVRGSSSFGRGFGSSSGFFRGSSSGIVRGSSSFGRGFGSSSLVIPSSSFVIPSSSSSLIKGSI